MEGIMEVRQECRIEGRKEWMMEARKECVTKSRLFCMYIYIYIYIYDYMHLYKSIVCTQLFGSSTPSDQRMRRFSASRLSTSVILRSTVYSNVVWCENLQHCFNSLFSDSSRNVASIHGLP